MRTITGDNYTLIHGDCLDVLPTFEAGSVDAVITDPPYGTTACTWDSVIPFEPMWAGIKHVLKPRGAVVLFGSQPFTSALVMSNVEWFRYEWIWKKSRPNGFLDANRKPMKTHENVLIFSEFGHLYNAQGLSRKNKPNKNSGIENVYGKVKKGHVQNITYTNYPNSILPVSSLQNSIHPTQKPVALMEYLIRTYTNEGDTVLDFTCGSGSTGVAAMRTGRRFIGVELDTDYFDIAHQRIANAAGDYVTTEAERAKGQMALWDVEL